MSHIHGRAARSASSVAPPLSSADVSAKLGQAAAALHSLAQSLVSFSGIKPESEAAEQDGRMPDVFRTYRVPGYIASEEEDLLEREEAGSIQEMLEDVCSRLGGIVLLMRNFSDEKEMDGDEVQSLGEFLLSFLDRLHQISSLLAGYELIDSDQSA